MQIVEKVECTVDRLRGLPEHGDKRGLPKFNLLTTGGAKLSKGLSLPVFHLAGVLHGALNFDMQNR